MKLVGQSCLLIHVGLPLGPLNDCLSLTLLAIIHKYQTARVVGKAIARWFSHSIISFLDSDHLQNEQPTTGSREAYVTPSQDLLGMMVLSRVAGGKCRFEPHCMTHVDGPTALITTVRFNSRPSYPYRWCRDRYNQYFIFIFTRGIGYPVSTQTGQIDMEVVAQYSCGG